jgi:hypothetical protein
MGKEMPCNQSQSFLMNVALTRVTKKLQFFFIEGTTSRNYIIASNVGVFEKHHVLLNLLVDVISNILSIHISGDKGNAK